MTEKLVKTLSLKELALCYGVGEKTMRKMVKEAGAYRDRTTGETTRLYPPAKVLKIIEKHGVPPNDGWQADGKGGGK